MGYGGSSRRRLLGVLIAGATFGAAFALAATVTPPMLRSRSQHDLDERARREVTHTAQLVRTGLLATPTTEPAELRFRAEQSDGVTVLGAERADDGTLLLFKVQVVKTGTTLFGYQQSSVIACFEQLVANVADAAPVHEIPCPLVEP